jgi:predicted NUDIX family NTP pyrophosphohydrolase
VKSRLWRRAVSLRRRRGSGRWLRFPEVDRYDWFRPQVAREKLNPAQTAFIDRLEAQLS